MVRALRTWCSVVVIVAAGLLGVAGCGSSSPTSSQEVAAVAKAEGTFLSEWGDVFREARKNCAPPGEVDPRRCPERVMDPLKLRAVQRFAKAIEVQLEGSLGPKCTEALEEALHTIPSVPSFRGTTTEACRAESES